MASKTALKLSFVQKEIPELFQLFQGSDATARVLAYQELIRRNWQDVLPHAIRAAGNEKPSRKGTHVCFRLLAEISAEAIPSMFDAALKHRRQSIVASGEPAVTHMEWRGQFGAPPELIRNPDAFDRQLNRAAEKKRRRKLRPEDLAYEFDDEDAALLEEMELDEFDDDMARLLSTAIAQHGEPAVAYALERIKDPDPQVVFIASMVLIDAEEFPLEQIMEFVDNELICRWLVSECACESLIQKPGAQADKCRQFVAAACRHESVRKSLSAYLFVSWRMPRRTDPATQSAMARQLLIPISRYVDIRNEVIRGLGTMPHTASDLVAALHDDSLRSGMMSALEHVGAPALPALIGGLSDPKIQESCAIVISFLRNEGAQALLRARDRLRPERNQGIYLSLKLGREESLALVLAEIRLRSIRDYLQSEPFTQDALNLLSSFGEGAIPVLTEEVKSGTHGLLAALSLARLGNVAHHPLRKLLSNGGKAFEYASMGLLAGGLFGTRDWITCSQADQRVAVYAAIERLPTCALRRQVVTQLVESVELEPWERLHVECLVALELRELLKRAFEGKCARVKRFLEDAESRELCSALIGHFGVLSTPRPEYDAMLLPRPHRVIPIFVGHLESSNAATRAYAAKMLKEIGAPAEPWLCSALTARQPKGAPAVLSVLEARKNPQLAGFLVTILERTKCPEVRLGILRALHGVEAIADRAAPIVWRCIEDGSSHVRIAGASVLQRLGAAGRPYALDMLDLARKFNAGTDLHQALRNAANALL
ncbi:MAG: hypothetical protein U0136_15985 [Bdellovibrionota bacterium]